MLSLLREVMGLVHGFDAVLPRMRSSRSNVVEGLEEDALPAGTRFSQLAQ